MECTSCRGSGYVGMLVGSARRRVPTPCLTCDGTGEIAEPTPAPTLADIITLLERQAKTCERIAATLTEIQYTVGQLK